MRITAPYNFAPLSDQVHRPTGGEWNNWQTLHDVPLKSAICGTLALTIRSDTPILCAQDNPDNNLKTPFTLPSNHYALPGSSLRGMIRNVLEIATFSRMNFVDDQRFGVRDLQPSAREFYGSHLAAIEKGKHNHYRAKSKAGWLKFVAGDWVLYPCDYGRVDHKVLAKQLGNNWITPRERPNAEKKYRAWLQKYQTLAISADIPEAEFHSHKNKHLFYSNVTSLTSKGDKILVMTGQPGPSKHMEFIFSAPTDKSVILGASVSRGFLDIYHDTDHWKYLSKNQAQFNNGIPVFYLTDNNGTITSLGLSQMYKLAYQHTVGDVIERTQAPNDYANPDLASRIFGQVCDSDTTMGDDNHNLKGRVSFSHARGPSCETLKPLAPVTTILNSPKPTFYPNYIEQDHKEGTLNPVKSNNNRRTSYSYTTLMASNPKLRGWKRYPVRPADDVQVQPLNKDQADNRKIQVRLQPLPAGTSFSGKLRFHNLLPEELGAILWAITWGGNDKLRHSIGMGKPFGYGVIQVEINQAQSTFIPNLNGSTPQINQLIEQYTDYINQPVPGWIDTPSMQQLLAMANPENAPGQPGALKHMDLATKDFTNAKKRNSVLLPYAKLKPPRALSSLSNDTPGGQWLEKTLRELEKEHHTPADKLMMGRPLAKAWDKIEDAAVKQQALELISSHWKKADRWDDPVGKAEKQARKIYAGEA